MKEGRTHKLEVDELHEEQQPPEDDHEHSEHGGALHQHRAVLHEHRRLQPASKATKCACTLQRTTRTHSVTRIMHN